MLGTRGRGFAASVVAVIGGMAFAGPAAADEPANGFKVSIEGSGTITRDGSYAFSESGFSEQGTVSTDGSYTFHGATMFDVYFPTAGTSKHTANFFNDSARSSFSGQVSATEQMTDSNGGSENSSCSAPYSSNAQDIFALAYRGAAGGAIELLVAPTVFANRDSTAISCTPDSYAVDQLLFPTQASFDGQSLEPNPPFEAYRRITLTQDQLRRASFEIPVSFTSQGTRSWLQGGDPPAGYCDFSVPADDSGSCSWKHTWSGTLRFTRVCSAGGGGTVAFQPGYQGRDGVQRWFANGYCAGGPGGEACVVPDLIGQKLRKAKRKLKRANCSLGNVKKAPSSRGDKGRVIKQKPRPKTVKPAGAKVKVTVGKG
jgi:hypothetical protein